MIGILHSTPPSNILYKLRYPNEPKHLLYKPANGKAKMTQAPLKKLYGKYVLTIPIQGEPIPDGSEQASDAYDEVASSYTIDGPNVHYRSQWQPAGYSQNAVSMYIAPDLAERLIGRHVKLQVNVVGRRLEPITTWSLGSPSGFDVPGNGHCLVYPSGNHSMLICSYAFASPPRTVIRERSENSTASTETSAAYVLHASTPSPAYDPIAQIAVALQTKPQVRSNFSVVAYQPTRNLHVTVEADNLDIAQYLQ